MARIRTIKPSFFRHGELQDLEVSNPGKHCMLVFAGLWGHCDRTGVFECDPRQLKLDLLPFLPFDMADTIGLLEQSGFLRRYEVDSKQYAVIPSFSEHQRIGGKEATEQLKHPREAEGKQWGSTREATVNKPGNGSEATGKHLPAQEVEGKGREYGAQRSRGSRLPSGWKPSSTLTEWALKERAGLDVAKVVDRFRDHWQAAPGSRGVKLDWDATFRNWVRNERGAVDKPAAPRADI